MTEETRNSPVVKSSAVYQILLYFDGWYFGAFILSELLIFIYKGVVLPYPGGLFASELLLLGFLTVVEASRNFLGRKGNLTEQILVVVVSLALTLPSLAGLLYYLIWQTYVLRIEVILVAIKLFFHVLQTILAIFCIVNFSR